MNDLKMQKVTGATKMLNISGNRTSNSLRDDDKKYSDFFFSSMIGPCFTCLLRERLKNCSCATSD